MSVKAWCREQCALTGVVNVVDGAEESQLETAVIFTSISYRGLLCASYVIAGLGKLVRKRHSQA